MFAKISLKIFLFRQIFLKWKGRLEYPLERKYYVEIKFDKIYFTGKGPRGDGRGLNGGRLFIQFTFVQVAVG